MECLLLLPFRELHHICKTQREKGTTSSNTYREREEMLVCRRVNSLKLTAKGSLKNSAMPQKGKYDKYGSEQWKNPRSLGYKGIIVPGGWINHELRILSNNQDDQWKVNVFFSANGSREPTQICTKFGRLDPGFLFCGSTSSCKRRAVRGCTQDLSIPCWMLSAICLCLTKLLRIRRSLATTGDGMRILPADAGCAQAAVPNRMAMHLPQQWIRSHRAAVPQYLTPHFRLTVLVVTKVQSWP